MGEFLKYIYLLVLLIFGFGISIILVYEVFKGIKRDFKNYYKNKQKHDESIKKFFKNLFRSLSRCIKFLFWGSIILIIVGAYVIAIFKWFYSSHVYFWTGFKELIWALMPILNIFYILK